MSILVPSHDLQVPTSFFSAHPNWHERKFYWSVLPPYIHEVNGSRSETYDSTKFSAHIDFTCPWNMRHDAYHALWWSAYNAQPWKDESDEISWVKTEVVNGHTSRTPMISKKKTRGYYSDYKIARPIKVQVGVWGAEGVKQQDKHDTYNYQPYTLAKLSVDYEGYARIGNRACQWSMQPTVSMRQLPAWKYYWYMDGAPCLDDAAPTLMEFKYKFAKQFDSLAAVPWYWLDCCGKTNDDDWTDMQSGKTFPPGTVLCTISNISTKSTYSRGDDDELWSVQLELTYNPIGWNQFQRPYGVDHLRRIGDTVYNELTNTFEVLPDTDVELYPSCSFPPFSYSELLTGGADSWSGATSDARWNPAFAIMLVYEDVGPHTGTGDLKYGDQYVATINSDGSVGDIYPCSGETKSLFAKCKELGLDVVGWEMEG